MSVHPATYDPDDAVWIEPEPIKAGTRRMRRWRQRNRMRALVQSQVAKHRTDARRRGVACTLTFAQWWAYLERVGWLCLCCGDQPDSLHIDCVKPMSKGGAFSLDNAQPLCGPCNRAKGTKEIDYRRHYERSNNA